MIKYSVSHETRTVYAWLENTRYDAYNKICKMIKDTDFCVCPHNKYMMPNKFMVKLVCDERDEFSVEFGKKRARKILLDNYYKSLDKHVAKFTESALVFNGKVFNTPENLENNS